MRLPSDPSARWRHYVLAVLATAPQRFAIIAAISLPLTLMIYELSIRRFDPVRVAFG